MKTVVARLSLVCISLIILGLMFSSQGYTRIDPKDIVGVWFLDEDTGKIAKDSSANGNDGEILGDLKWDKGKFGNALLFPGVDGKHYIQVPESEEQNLPDAFTIVMWLKIKSRGENQRLFSKDDGKRNYVFEINFGAGDTARIAYSTGGVCCSIADAQDKVTDDLWHHVAGTYGKPFLRAYVDGKGGKEEKFDESPDMAGGPIIIGARPAGTGTILGLMDEVALFKVALNEDEIKILMNKGLKTTTAVSLKGKLTIAWGKLKAEN
ncbi:LamG domain-containing protein [Candidatus Poribacteria bacterium]|nr:LamG domain-containing protein [Candidatus Poribacteria bacterium]